MKTIGEIAEKLGALAVHRDSRVEPKLEQATKELGCKPSSLPAEWQELLAMENYFVYYSAWIAALEWVLEVKIDAGR